MSLILKGVNLPKDTQAITVNFIGSSDIYPIFSSVRVEKENIIALSTDHGKLIDLSNIEIGRWDIDTDLAEQILNAPIILEVEENI